MIKRRESRQIRVGDLFIGGNAKISVQSMTNTRTTDVKAMIEQIERLKTAGCELVRVAVVDEESARALRQIKDSIAIPLVADIHFDYKLALLSMDNGADKIRINPGNIGSEKGLKSILDKAKEMSVPIRIGVNSGSLHKKYKEAKGGLSKALVDSALEYTNLFEKHGFGDYIISVKAASPMETVEAYRQLSKKSDAPLHIGQTEAGTLLMGAVKSSVVLGILLAEGIGDTLRVSLTDDPVREVEVGYKILSALDIRRDFIEVISCPTCGRCGVDLITLTQEVEDRLSTVRGPLKVAVMGCVVNGPGEARMVDVGIAAGLGEGLLFVGGRPVRKVCETDLVDVLVEYVMKMRKGQQIV
ncbi:MAG: flavodoxin-dependent (E)-4-hydroxy-3-methylbut-2-enyl-diphosphate synthase [Actinomycetota bacterium]|nr:flavodoxin-dependent (E)-4-hydroxy-3-methylbut-2-enyl-diphosphate synthase [Actinomycetota bacterium]